jgi:23S rRNA pseudouridine1911/1915/1917 synthase
VLSVKKRKKNKVLQIPIVYEDDDLILVDKPPRVVVNISDSTREFTLQGWAEEKIDFKTEVIGIEASNLQLEEKNAFVERAGIVHRLDKDTSGLLIIAKNRQSFSILQKQFFERKVTKKYFALVHGIVSLKKGKIQAPVGRLPWDRMKFGVISSGREAETEYEVLSYFQKGMEKFSFIDIHPLTGRTHQIRIHFKYLGFPLVSDPLYSGRVVFRNDLDLCKRLFLHAHYLGFYHPKSLKFIDFEIPLPEDLKKVMDKATKIALY